MAVDKCISVLVAISYQCQVSSYVNDWGWNVWFDHLHSSSYFVEGCPGQTICHFLLILTLYLSGSLQVANSMRLVLLNVSLYVLVIQVSTRDSITGPCRLACSYLTSPFLIDFTPYEWQTVFYSKWQNILTLSTFVSLTFVIIEKNDSDVPWNRWPV